MAPEPPMEPIVETQLPPTSEPIWFPDAAPKNEPLAQRGNGSYRVHGTIYRVWRQVRTYTAEGTAVWRDSKYDDHTTLSGEAFNNDALVAAHRHLAIPAYLRVTNLDNDVSIVVRVNDRGPFYGNHILAVSRAAALKLGFGEARSRPVRIELVSEEVPSFALETDYVYGRDEAFRVLSRLTELNLGHLSTTIMPHQYENRYRVLVREFASVEDARYVSDWILSNLQLASLILKD